MLHLACGVGDGIEDRHEIRAVLGRAIDLAVCIHPRIAPIRGDRVMQIGRGAAPVPERDNGIALDPLRPLRLGERQLAGGDAIGPVAEQLERALRVEAAYIAGHEHLGTARHQTALPGLRRILELTELLRDGPHSRRAERMAGLTGTGFDDVEPFSLALDLRQRKLVLSRHVQHGEPVDGRINLRRSGRIGRRNRCEIDDLARLSARLGQIDETVTANPDVVVRLGKIRDQVTPLIIGHDDLGELCGKIGRLRDHPDPGFRPARPRDRTAKRRRRP